jgi:hypothetical protein
VSVALDGVHRNDAAVLCETLRLTVDAWENAYRGLPDDRRLLRELLDSSRRLSAIGLESEAVSGLLSPCGRVVQPRTRAKKGV